MEASQSNLGFAQRNQALWDAFLNGDSLFFLLKRAADILDCTLILRCDSLYWAEPGNEAPRLDRKTAFRIISACEVRRQEGLPEPIASLPKELAGFASSALCFALTFHGKNQGTLVACRVTAGFTPEESQLCTNLGGMCAMLLGRISAAGINVPHEALFNALLSGETVPLYFGKQPRLPPPDSGRNTQILTIDPRGASFETQRTISDIVSTMVTCSMRTLYRGYIVLLYHGRSIYPLEEQHNFLEYLKRNGCICGLSRVFSDLNQTSAYFEQSRVAIMAGSRLFPERVLHDYENFSMEHAIITALRQLPPNALVSPRLRALCDADSSRGGELVETLRSYLENINNLGAAADELHIHRNTLFYRLRKIEDITGWDLDSGSCLNNINFYLKVMDLGFFF